MVLVGLTLASIPAHAALTLQAEVNPEPVEPSQMLDVQLAVSSSSISGALTLQLLWPAELATSPITTGGGDCPGTFCEAGELLSWNLGVLGADTTVTVSFNEFVRSTTIDGTMIPLEVELLEDGFQVATLSLSAEVQSDSPLELAIDPLSDPVASAGTLVYELIYGNTGGASSQNTVLEMPIPAAAEFVSATGGGVFSDGTVSWSLDNLPANVGGRQRVTVQVDALSEGSLLQIDAAVLSGEVSALPKEARAMVVSRVATEILELELEVNPDPVDPNQLQETQITVGNPGGGPTGILSLRLLWPEEFSNSPITTGGGVCPGTFCEVGEYLSWDLGLLGANSSVTVSFDEFVQSTAINGTLIPLEFELLEDGQPARNISHTTITQADSPLELAVDPLSDPVASNGTLVYELVYGNTGGASSQNTVLNVPIPAGAQFVSATGGGVFSDGSVSWSLGNLPRNDGGRQRVTVQVDALSEGTLLLIDAAVLSGEVSALPKVARAMAVSRVATEILELELEVNPDPVDPNQLQDTQITVGNPGGGTTGTLSLHLLWPEEYSNSPITTGGGDCPGTFCEVGEYLSWDLGLLGANKSVTVSFNELVRTTTVNGTLIPLEFELLEDGLPARNISHTTITQADSPLELTVFPLPDPVVSSGTVVYELVYGNTGGASSQNTVLNMPIPAGAQFVSATGGGVFFEGNVSWSLGNLSPPNGGGRQRVTVEVDALSDGSLLLLDAAVLSGEVGFLTKVARAMAVSRVATETLDLNFVVVPNPVTAGENLNVEITVDNLTVSPTGTLILRLLWPEELTSSPVATDGGDCPGTFCEAGEYLSWDLGLLGVNSSVKVGFVESVRNTEIVGTLIPLEFELLEDGLLARIASQTVLIHPFDDNDEDGEADVFDEDDDNDGMPDWCELLYGLDPFYPGDADLDPDMDGLTNLEECQAGTDPNVHNDLLFKDGFELIE